MKRIILFILLLVLVGCTLSTNSGNSGLSNLESENATLRAQLGGQNPQNSSAPSNVSPGENPGSQTATPTVAHQVYPGSPAGVSGWVSDPSSKANAASRSSDSDEFSNLKFERPFTSEVMDYQGHLDIIRAEISTSSPFIYLTIFVEEAPPANSTAKYGIEIDLNKDGRGDWLIYGQAPTTSDWTSAGVRGYKDNNFDVGASIPIVAEGAVSGLTGYDTLVFDQGYNTSDPDAAWIRLDPSNSTHIQLAFKSSLIGSPSTFMWGAWTDEGPAEPAWFDYNDHFSLAEAGSPISNSSEYPIKQLYSVDNTCRWGYGFNPTGSEPGVCYVPPTPTITPSPTPVLYGSISGGVWKDLNSNNLLDVGENAFSGVTVRLGSGSCGSTGLATQSTSVLGGVTFSNLLAGTYCISVNIPVSCDGWIPTTVTQYTVVLGPGEDRGVNWFGYANSIC